MDLHCVCVNIVAGSGYTSFHMITFLKLKCLPSSQVLSFSSFIAMLLPCPPNRPVWFPCSHLVLVSHQVCIGPQMVLVFGWLLVCVCYLAWWWCWELGCIVCTSTCCWCSQSLPDTKNIFQVRVHLLWPIIGHLNGWLLFACVEQLGCLHQTCGLHKGLCHPWMQSWIFFVGAVRSLLSVKHKNCPASWYQTWESWLWPILMVQPHSLVLFLQLMYPMWFYLLLAWNPWMPSKYDGSSMYNF